MTDDINGTADIRELARQRIEEKRDYWRMFIWFGALIVLCIGVWLFTGIGTYFWPVWPAIGAAIILVIRGYNTFGRASRPVSEAAIDAEVRKLNS